MAVTEIPATGAPPATSTIRPEIAPPGWSAKSTPPVVEASATLTIVAAVNAHGHSMHATLSYTSPRWPSQFALT